eukprot:g4264.t1
MYVAQRQTSSPITTTDSVLSDGGGRISIEQMARVHASLELQHGKKIEGHLMGIQVRAGCNKGMLFLDTSLPTSSSVSLNRAQVVFTESMAKGSRDESRLCSLQQKLEICPQGIVASKDSRDEYKTLNDEFVPLLEFLCSWEPVAVGVGGNEPVPAPKNPAAAKCSSSSSSSSDPVPAEEHAPDFVPADFFRASAGSSSGVSFQKNVAKHKKFLDWLLHKIHDQHWEDRLQVAGMSERMDQLAAAESDGWSADGEKQSPGKLQQEKRSKGEQQPGACLVGEDDDAVKRVKKRTRAHHEDSQQEPPKRRRLADKTTEAVFLGDMTLTADEPDEPASAGTAPEIPRASSCSSRATTSTSTGVAHMTSLGSILSRAAAAARAPSAGAKENFNLQRQQKNAASVNGADPKEVEKLVARLRVMKPVESAAKLAAMKRHAVASHQENRNGRHLLLSTSKPNGVRIGLDTVLEVEKELNSERNGKEKATSSRTSRRKPLWSLLGGQYRVELAGVRNCRPRPGEPAPLAQLFAPGYSRYLRLARKEVAMAQRQAATAEDGACANRCLPTFVKPSTTTAPATTADAALPSADLRRAELVDRLQLAGFDTTNHAILWHSDQARKVQEAHALQKKPRFQVPQSRYFVVAYDHSQTLRAGQAQLVFFEAGQFWYLEGRNLVGACPAHLPTDLQLLQFVEPHEKVLRRFGGGANLLILAADPETCSRGSNDEFRGGDYDGDINWVCWNSDLVSMLEHNAATAEAVKTMRDEIWEPQIEKKMAQHVTSKAPKGASAPEADEETGDAAEDSEMSARTIAEILEPESDDGNSGDTWKRYKAMLAAVYFRYASTGGSLSSLTGRATSRWFDVVDRLGPVHPRAIGLAYVARTALDMVKGNQSPRAVRSLLEAELSLVAGGCTRTDCEKTKKKPKVKDVTKILPAVWRGRLQNRATIKERKAAAAMKARTALHERAATAMKQANSGSLGSQSGKEVAAGLLQADPDLVNEDAGKAGAKADHIAETIKEKKVKDGISSILREYLRFRQLGRAGGGAFFSELCVRTREAITEASSSGNPAQLCYTAAMQIVAEHTAAKKSKKLGKTDLLRWKATLQAPFALFPIELCAMKAKAVYGRNMERRKGMPALRMVAVSELLFSQAEISPTFSDTAASIEKMRDDLVAGRLSVFHVPALQIHKRRTSCGRDDLHSADNRRLWAFKEALRIAKARKDKNRAAALERVPCQVFEEQRAGPTRCRIIHERIEEMIAKGSDGKTTKVRAAIASEAIEERGEISKEPRQEKSAAEVVDLISDSDG